MQSANEWRIGDKTPRYSPIIVDEPLSDCLVRHFPTPPFRYPIFGVGETSPFARIVPKYSSAILRIMGLLSSTRGTGPGSLPQIGEPLRRKPRWGISAPVGPSLPFLCAPREGAVARLARQQGVHPVLSLGVMDDNGAWPTGREHDSFFGLCWFSPPYRSASAVASWRGRRSF